MTIRTNTGENLNKEWGVNANHALYHRDGHFYECLTRFPGALFDQKGYLKFETEEDFRNCPYLDIHEKVNVSQDVRTISCIPGYVRVLR